MTETSYSILLQNLSSDYYHNHIGFDEYRQQRKKILDQIDEEMNGEIAAEASPDESENSAIVMQASESSKNSEIEQ